MPRAYRPLAQVPAGPLAAFLAAEQHKYDSAREMGVRFGIDERTIARLVNAEHRHVGLEIVDRVLTRHGDPLLLHELYPLDQEQRDIYCATCAQTVTVGPDARCPWCETPEGAAQLFGMREAA